MEKFYFPVLIIITLSITYSIITTIKRGNYHLNNYYHSRVQSYVLNTSGSLYKTNKLFLSFSIDSHQIRHGLSKPSLSNSELIRLTSYLSPGYLRIGGTDADRLVFKRNNSVSRSRPNSNLQDTFNMSDKKWTEIYRFAELSGFRILFDLNVLLRNGSRWDSSNAKSLLDFSASKGYKVDWQLGNEPNAFQHNFNETVSPFQLAKDFITLRNLLNSYPKYQKALVVGPDVTSPHSSLQEVTMPAEKFLHKFMKSGSVSQPVDAVAWHHYYLHRNASLSDVLSPGVFDTLKQAIDLVKEAVKSWRLLWITESGSVCGGGVPGLSNRFASSFLLLDKLGLAAREGVALVVRQSLYAGHYALIDRTTLRPNPLFFN
uniref:Heparanase n=1 Tax=Homalodisca liturata TaxID=320908 RepID=A0A1B6HW10_9HEMI